MFFRNCLVAFFLPFAFLYANPVGEQVVAGSAGFARDGSTLTVNQGSDRAIINWQGFSIDAGELTRFIQPGASSAALNRVISGNPSSLLGTLQSNGQVYLINPNGILVGAGAKIDCGAFIASTLDVNNAEFMGGGDLHFAGTSTAGIQNLGAINAIGGDVFLIAHTVENTGTITAPNGVAGIAAGHEVLLTQSGNERLAVKLGTLNPEPGTQTGIQNAGLIAATQAELKAANGNIYALAINNEGAIRASAMVNRGGRIVLTSDGGKISNSGILAARQANGDGGAITLNGGRSSNSSTPSRVLSSGTLDASGTGSGAKGGTVQLLGDQVGLLDGALVDVSGATDGGTILVGGDFQGKNPAVQNALATYVAKDAVLKADGGVSNSALDTRHSALGNGGRVIIWADNTTRFYGNISARGGAEGGDGGFVEVSGHSLDFHGRVELGALNGVGGSVLIDPSNITISNGADTNTSGFTPPGDQTEVFFDDIGLNSVFDVTPGTGSFAGVGAGTTINLYATNDITVNNAFDLATATGVANVSLWLRAENNINLNAVVSATGTGTLQIWADDDVSGAGNIAIGAAGGLSTAGQTIDLFAATLSITPGGTINSGAGDITVRSSASSTVGLGAGAGTLNITDAEFDAFTTSGTLTIGNANATTITVDTLSVPASISGTLVLNAGSGVIVFSGGASTFPAALNLTSTAAGGITQSVGISVTGTTTLAAGAGNDITLNNAANDFSTVAITSGRNVTLRDTNAIDLGASTVSGTLTVTAGGAITDSGNLAVTGTTTLAAGAANNITLDSAGNNFSTVAVTSGRNVTLVDAGAINLGNSTVSGNLNVTAGGLIDFNGAGASTVAGTMGLTTTAGGITDSGAGSLGVTGVSTLAAGAANNITLDNAANDFSIVTVTSVNNATLRDVNQVIILDSTITGNGTVTVGGGIAVGNSTVGGTSTLTPGGAIDLPTITVNGNLLVQAVGAITDSGTVAVTGTTTLAAGAGNNITLDSAGNSFSTVIITSGNNVTLVDANAIDLGASTVSGTLTVTAGGAITDSGNLAVTGTTTLAAGAGNNITLDSAGNNFSTVAITSGNNVTLVDASAIDLGASTVSGTLSITAGGAITDSGNLAVTGTTTLAASAGNNITLDSAGNNFSTVIITSGNNVTLVDANAIDLGASTVSGTLAVTSSGAITDSGNLAVTGTTTLAAGAGNDITLDNAGNNFSTVVIISGNVVALVGVPASASSTGTSTAAGGFEVVTVDNQPVLENTQNGRNAGSDFQVSNTQFGSRGMETPIRILGAQTTFPPDNFSYREGGAAGGFTGRGEGVALRGIASASSYTLFGAPRTERERKHDATPAP